MSRFHPRGFTLLELLATVAIIALLLSMTFVSIDYFKTRARDAKRLANIDALKKALNIYYTQQNQKYPISLDATGVNAEICVTGKDSLADGANGLLAKAGITLQPISDPVWPETVPNAGDPDRAGHCYTYFSSDGKEYTVSYYLELGIQGKRAKHNSETH